MTKDEIIKLLREHRADLERLDVKSLALFGSVARGEAGKNSDVDFLVEFSGKATFDRYMTLKLLLEDLLGRPVDLITQKALRPQMRPEVEKEAVNVA